jgi:hypothetical protein
MESVRCKCVAGFRDIVVKYTFSSGYTVYQKEASTTHLVDLIDQWDTFTLRHQYNLKNDEYIVKAEIVGVECNYE